MNSPLWKASLLLLPMLWVASDARAQASYDLRSPDNKIEARIRTAKSIRYDVLLKGRALLQDCTLSLDVDHKTLGLEPKVIKSKERSYNQVIEPPVRQKFASAAASENLRRRGELSFSKQFHHLLPTGRQLFFTQRAEICSPAIEGDCARVHRDVAGSCGCGKRRKSRDRGIGRGRLSGSMAARHGRKRAEWNFSSISFEGKTGTRS